MGAQRRRKKYHAVVGGRTIEVEIGDDDVVIDGATHSFSAGRISSSHFSLIIDGRSVPALVYSTENGNYAVHVGGFEFEVVLKDEKDLLLEQFGFVDAAAGGLREIRAPMPGLVLSLLIEPGQVVKPGDGLVVLEAMKMENELRAEVEGIVKTVHVEQGDAVGKNDLLMEIEA